MSVPPPPPSKLSYLSSPFHLYLSHLSPFAQQKKTIVCCCNASRNRWIIICPYLTPAASMILTPYLQWVSAFFTNNTMLLVVTSSTESKSLSQTVGWNNKDDHWFSQTSLGCLVLWIAQYSCSADIKVPRLENLSPKGLRPKLCTDTEGPLDQALH